MGWSGGKGRGEVSNSGNASPIGAEDGLLVEPFDGSATEWDTLLEGFSGSTFCHLGGWRTVMSEALGHELLYRVAVDKVGEIRGLLPMVRVRSRLFGDYLVSMPFLSYGGPLGSPSAQARLAENAAQEAQELGVDLLELRSRSPVPGALTTSHRKLTVLLDLPESARVLWEDGLKGKVRSQVRRPMKEDMEPCFRPEQLDSFYAVFSRTMRDLGTPVLHRGFFEAVAAEFPGQVLFCAIEFEGNPVAAGCGFLWNGECEITWAGSLREFNRLAPNMLLYWAFMEEAIVRGARMFNFGRCTPGSGTHRFKRQWGGEDYSLPWAQWSPGPVTSTPTPTGRKYRAATAVWKVQISAPFWPTDSGRFSPGASLESGASFRPIPLWICSPSSAPSSGPLLGRPRLAEFCPPFCPPGTRATRSSLLEVAPRPWSWQFAWRGERGRKGLKLHSRLIPVSTWPLQPLGRASLCSSTTWTQRRLHLTWKGFGRLYQMGLGP